MYILGLGHPKTGTGYTAHLLKAHGFEILHEKNGKDGMTSWLACVNRDDQLWGQKPEPGDKKYFIIAKSPLDAMLSVIGENNNWKSLSWRRLAIKDKLGIDIFDENVTTQDAVGLAVASLYYWYQICFSFDYEFIYRVDDHTDNKLLSELLGKRITRKKDVHRNSHPERYAGFSYTTQDLNNLSQDWKSRLAELCEKLGYPKDQQIVLDMI